MSVKHSELVDNGEYCPADAGAAYSAFVSDEIGAINRRTMMRLRNGNKQTFLAATWDRKLELTQHYLSFRADQLRHGWKAAKLRASEIPQAEVQSLAMCERSLAYAVSLGVAQRVAKMADQGSRPDKRWKVHIPMDSTSHVQRMIGMYTLDHMMLLGKEANGEPTDLEFDLATADLQFELLKGQLRGMEIDEAVPLCRFGELSIMAARVGMNGRLSGIDFVLVPDAVALDASSLVATA